MRKRNRLWLLAIVGLLIIASIVAYAHFVPAPNSSLTNARSGYNGEYTYITHSGLSPYYVNKFSINVTSVSGNEIYFIYDQTVAANTTINNPIPTNNYTLAVNPSDPSALESGSALPLFVANNLKPGEGTSELPASTTEPAIPVNYSISITRGLILVNFTVGSRNGSSPTVVNWRLEYNQTTGFLISGSSTISGSELLSLPPETFQYSMISFSKESK